MGKEQGWGVEKCEGCICWPVLYRLSAFVPSVSMDSSLMETQDEMLQVLKEKTRLEGQLEALSLEATQVSNVGMVCLREWAAALLSCLPP